MNVDEYLAKGEEFNGRGHRSDGCTLVGWFVHKLWPNLRKACWSHDYGRRGLIAFDGGQYENDKLFRSALKKLGAPGWLRATMFLAVRFQGITNISPMFILAFLFLGSFILFALWHSGHFS